MTLRCYARLRLGRSPLRVALSLPPDGRTASRVDHLGSCRAAARLCRGSGARLTLPHTTRTCAGLLYEDVLVETPDVQLALKRLPKDVMDARELRLKRAMVLSSQQKRLPPEVAAMHDPFKSYLGPYLEAIEQEKVEMAKLPGGSSWR